jgi:ABC-2 type transport system permease protein
VLFAYVFGSAITLPGGGDYRAFLMPGIFMQTMALTAVQAATSTNTDMTQGIIDRFRSMPIARQAVLTGTNLAALSLRVLGLTGMVGCALVLTSWQPHRGVADTAYGFGLLVLFGFAMIWVGTFIGLSTSSPTVADQATFGWLFPLTFLANTFVPTSGLPNWLRPVADWNPMSATVASMRHLFGNPSPMATHTAWPLRHPEVTSLTWSVLLLAVFIPLAIWRYRKASAR